MNRIGLKLSGGKAQIWGIIYMTSVHQFVVAPQSYNSQNVAFSDVKYIIPHIQAARQRINWPKNV